MVASSTAFALSSAFKRGFVAGAGFGFGFWTAVVVYANATRKAMR